MTAIAVNSLERERENIIPRELLTDDSLGLVSHPEADVVVETIGGLELARTLILRRYCRKHVVTANKALLATHGPELFAAADAASRDLIFEASVGGGIPIIRMLREGMASDRLESIYGIINGTSNYILTAMTQKGRAYEEVLAEAQDQASPS